MKVIMLDIDGVLNVYSYDRDEYGALFHSPFVENLRDIIGKTGAKIVISSSWRVDGIITMKNLWKDRELPGEIIDITPNKYDIVNEGLSKFYDLVCRGDEIQLWLNRHPEVTNYCIVDDDDDMLDSQLDNYVKCSNNQDHEDCLDIGYGLTKECSRRVIEILNRF